MDLRGLRAHFAIRDIAFPSPDAVLKALHADDILAGQIVDVSESDDRDHGFVVVAIAGLEQPVVVHIAHVRLSRGDSHDE
jgi:hypothetical protein